MMPQEILYFITAARLLVPLLILVWPLGGAISCMLVDMFDWKIFPVHTAGDYHFYQLWDKSMDLACALFMARAAWNWPDQRARWFGMFLFSYRLIGIALFFFTGWQAVLFFFPNIFDIFYILYLLFSKLLKQTQLFTSWSTTAYVVVGLSGPKLIHEYFMHYLDSQPWEYYDVGAWLGLNGLVHEYTNYAIWGGLLYLVPFALLFVFVKRRLNGKEVATEV